MKKNVISNNHDLAACIRRQKQVMKEQYELYKGDCLEVMKSIPDKSVDMILCDLPYGTSRFAGERWLV